MPILPGQSAHFYASERSMAHKLFDTNRGEGSNMWQKRRFSALRKGNSARTAFQSPIRDFQRGRISRFWRHLPPVAEKRGERSVSSTEVYRYANRLLSSAGKRVYYPVDTFPRATNDAVLFRQPVASEDMMALFFWLCTYFALFAGATTSFMNIMQGRR